jgi:DNA-directed RNA polymerase specialized sigma24 family protein
MTVLTGPAVVAHGYTYGQVDQLARYAVRRFRAGRIAGFEEYAVEPPSESDLLRAAGKGIYAFNAEYEQANGWDHKTNQVRGRFVKFWTNPHPGLPEAVVIDRLAVKQILPTLTPAQRDALLLLALFDGDGRRAAEALGVNYSAFKMRIKTARDRFHSYWFEGETPPGWYKNTIHHPAARPDAKVPQWAQDKGRCRRFHGPDCGCWRPPEGYEEGSGGHDD